MGATEWKPIEEYPVKKLVFLNFEPEQEFHNFVRSNILGPQGAHLKHIQNETGVRVQLRGQGSGFVDLSPSRGTKKSPMHLFIAASNESDAASAIKLADDLIATVKTEYESQLVSKQATSNYYQSWSQYYAQYAAYYNQYQFNPQYRQQ